MTDQEAIVYLEGQWDCMCSEDCQIYTGHKDCPQGFICNDGQALQMAISALQAQELKQEVKNSNESSLTQKPLDTISRTTAIDALKGLPTWWADEGGYYGGAQPPMVALLDPEDAVSAIENLPPAQPEIIRCKDCKHHWTHRCMDSMPKGICELDQTFYDANVDFCSLAERRTDEDD